MNDEIVFSKDKPNMRALCDEYESTVGDLDFYFDECEDSYNQRRALWTGKNRSLTKRGPAAFPWDGASDTEVRLVESKMRSMVSYMMNSLDRSNINAYARGVEDVRDAETQSQWLRFLKDSYIPGFRNEMERACNYMLEKGMAVTYVDWEERLDARHIVLDNEAIAREVPQFAEVLMDENREEEAVAVVSSLYPEADEDDVREALEELRETGTAKMAIVTDQLSRPVAETKAPDADVFWPAYVKDPRDSHVVFIRFFYTEQDLRNIGSQENWDEDVIDFIAKNHKGVTTEDIRGPYGNRTGGYGRRKYDFAGSGSIHAPELIEIVYALQRTIDEDTNAEGIYRTVFCPKTTFTRHDREGKYLEHQLLEGYDEFPIVVTPIGLDTDEIYNQQTIPQLLRGIQKTLKSLRDGTIDQISIANAPPLIHSPGREPPRWGAAAWIPARPNDRLELMPIQSNVRENVEMERMLSDEADALCGLRRDDPLSLAQQQYYVNKFLLHVSRCLAAAHKAYLRFGPDSDVYFRVTGSPQPYVVNKQALEEDFDVRVSFDSQMLDPKIVSEQWKQMVELVQLDRNGTIDLNRLIQVRANDINPAMADAILRPVEESREEVLKNVAEDIALIWSGQSVVARPNGAQIALQYINEVYLPKNMDRLQQNPTVLQDLQEYIGGYQMQIMQQQNAVQGAQGQPIADLQGVEPGL